MHSRITQSFPVGLTTVAALAISHTFAAAMTVETTINDSRSAASSSVDTQICIDAPAAVLCLAAAGTVDAFCSADSAVSSRVCEVDAVSTRGCGVAIDEEGETPGECTVSAVQEFRSAVLDRL